MVVGAGCREGKIAIRVLLAFYGALHAQVLVHLAAYNGLAL